MSREIQLTRGKIAIVDDADFERLSAFSWHAVPATRPGNWYARTSGQVYMHRMIAGVDGLDVDHKDGDGLNNMRLNLRPCIHRLNIANTIRPRPASGYKGVYWDPKKGKFDVRVVTYDGKRKRLGRFNDPVEAAKIRDAYVSELYGEFASLNFQRAD